MKSVQELDVYSIALELVKDIYLITKSFPKEETFGITSQMRRCAVSIPANITEGFYRNSTGDYVRFINIANSSNAELSTLLEIAKEIGLLTEQQFNQLISKVIRIRKMLIKLRISLESKID